MADTKPPKVAIVWRGDRQARDSARADSSRLKAVFEALARHGIAAEPAVWSEDLTGEVRDQLLAMDGVLVWVDPIATATGERRGMLDDLLREVSESGVFVSTHPDVTAKMGVKAVLYRTRELGWGTDSDLYETEAAFRTEFPRRLASGPRVLKQNRGNGGIGVWKVEPLAGTDIRVQEAKGASESRTLPLATFLAERAADFDDGGDDSYVLCEINVSSVFPIPDEAPDTLAQTTLERLAAIRARRRTEA